MKQYKTVREVCQLTGLTRKHLYYFHHENVVRATAHANYSVEGNVGYKLYDHKAVEKLQQIALFYQLGLKRNEIRDMMSDSNYNFITALDILLTRAKEKCSQLNRQIIVLEHLKHTATPTGFSSDSIRGILEYLAEHSETYEYAHHK